MYEPQDDDVTREADAIEATEMAQAVTSVAGADSSVVGAFAWSQEDGSLGPEPVPYVDDGYEQAPGTGRRPAVAPPPAPVPGRRHPSRLPLIALGFGILAALIAVAGALYSLTRTADDDVSVQPETSAAVVPPAPTSTVAPPPIAPPPPSEIAPPPVATTSAPPAETTTTAPPTTTTTTAPPTTTTTTAPPTTTTTTTAPPTTTTTAPSSTTAPPSSTVPPTTTVPMTTEYLRIPLVPIPIPITVPQN